MFRRDFAHSDTERGHPPTSGNLNEELTAPELAHDSTRYETNDKLQHFRIIVGISSPPTITHHRPAQNLGIYTRVVHNEARAKKNHAAFNFVINGCLGLQIIVAAALTAMGAANSDHAGITVLGAINTVIAGFLTFLKGSGLPGRLKYYQNEWKSVREYIEQREREFSQPGCRLDVVRVVESIERMYNDIKSDVEASQPDSFVGANSKKSALSMRVPLEQETLAATDRSTPMIANTRSDIASEKANEDSRDPHSDA